MANKSKPLDDNALLEISRVAADDESRILESLIATLGDLQAKRNSTKKLASKLIRHIRLDHSVVGVEGFMNQFGLNNYEGITIMCMAEALLRIPDNHTADRLIHDKLKATQWDSYLGHSDSLFVNASLWGLALTGNVINLDKEGDTLKHMRNKMVGRIGEPVIRNALKKAMKTLGAKFVIGNDIVYACKEGKKLEMRGYRLSYDMLGEGARTDSQASQYFEQYAKAIETVAESRIETELLVRPSISIKLSALHPRYEWTNRENVMAEMMPKLRELVLLAKKHDVAVSFDAEESSRLDLQLKVFHALITDKIFDGYNGIGFVLQAYQKRSLAVAEWLKEVAQVTGKRIPIRLVKGAYWDSEIHYAQQQGLSSYPVFTEKHHTDISYIACARFLLSESACFYPQFATHNAYTIASIITLGKGKEFEFQRLFGMGQEVYDSLVKEHDVRIYAPVGRTQELLPYLIRRLIENGANSSFVNQVFDDEVSISDLTICPIEHYQYCQQNKPPKRLPLPDGIVSGRVNSHGVDWGNASSVLALLKSRAPFLHMRWEGGAIVDGEESLFGKIMPVECPSDVSHTVGSVRFCRKMDVNRAIDSAADAFALWNARTVSERADIMCNIAKILEVHQAELITLLQLEAGKSLADAIDEIREAIDFCRYYACEAEKLFADVTVLDAVVGESNVLSYEGKGVFACISPWNFPLAIFAGQIVAALVTGNCVVAKPAKQTSLIAYRVVQLMHKAGVPESVLHLVVGDAVKIGEVMCSSSVIKGVVFTGSCQTARYINRQLAKRDGAIASLLAETGGLNAMLVDSTALPEQTIDNIVHSAFGSAGQRCSALRVVFLQEDIADHFIVLLKGAMDRVRVGNILDESIDIGPVIDAEAHKNISNYVRRMKRKKRVIHQQNQRLGDEKGHYIQPTLIELENIGELTEEIFGPILHIVRFDRHDVDHVIGEVNASGYGLTFGLQSRIEQRYQRLANDINVGNVYVNRTMTGAVVGMQPFGGRGLSGTGPKAGGPNYLRHFVHEKTVSINLAAIGGDVELLS